MSGIANVHDGDVPDTPLLPYVLVMGSAQSPSKRALSRDVHGRVERWRTTVVGANQTSAHIICRKVIAALEGARVAGQRVEAVPNVQHIMQDLDVSPPVSYAVLDWRVTLP
ncbi:hypothetical protein GCM10022377_10190 [Zhihengliuella alba]|uniref:DUF3168 domain-containing protein n=1 Tax=Zhihengliuella alba TaxID=547018 RepID=A0ABP7D3N0_9MICC